MRVIYEVGSYNPRRYGKPWIARVEAWEVGKNPALTFGANVGAYMAEVEAAPGGLVRFGQKDGRGNNTARFWGVVQVDGRIARLDAEAARKHWLAGCPVPSDAATGEDVP